MCCFFPKHTSLRRKSISWLARNHDNVSEWIDMSTRGRGCVVSYPGADPGFQVRGAHLKKLRRAEGGAKFFGVFRVKNHDFTPKNHILSNCGGRREILGVFRVKNHDFMQKNHIFSNFRGTRAGCPPLDPPLLPLCKYNSAYWSIKKRLSLSSHRM